MDGGHRIERGVPGHSERRTTRFPGRLRERVHNHRVRLPMKVDLLWMLLPFNFVVFLKL